MRKVVPASFPEFMEMAPLWDVMIFFSMGSPGRVP